MVRNILIVDDDKPTLFLLEKLINNFSSELNVFVTSDGSEGLTIFNKEDISIIISDINMPKINGIDLLKKVREIDNNVKFILLSCDLKNDRLLEIINFDVDSIFPKPITPKSLKIVLNKAIDSLDRRNMLVSKTKHLEEYEKAINDSSIVSKTDPKGFITYVNDAFCKISGYSRDELIGKNHNIVRNPDTPKKVFTDLWDIISSGHIWQGEITSVNKNGDKYTVLATINPIVDDNGNIQEYIALRQDLSEQVSLREQLSKKVDIMRDHICYLTKEMFETQEEVIFTLGQVTETRSQETGNHVKRVSEYSFLLARLVGLSDEDCNTIRITSPMHDIGKIGIPDSILNKPGKLTKAEFRFMEEHTSIGHNILNKSDKPLIKAASIVAHEHHEKWDGSGYPRKLVGEDIHIYARITTVADVFDALGHDRVYKKAWPNDEIFKLLKKEKGKHFDPSLIDLFFDNLDKFLEIKDKFNCDDCGRHMRNAYVFSFFLKLFGSLYIILGPGLRIIFDKNNKKDIIKLYIN